MGKLTTHVDKKLHSLVKELAGGNSLSQTVREILEEYFGGHESSAKQDEAEGTMEHPLADIAAVDERITMLEMALSSAAGRLKALEEKSDPTVLDEEDAFRTSTKRAVMDLTSWANEHDRKLERVTGATKQLKAQLDGVTRRVAQLDERLGAMSCSGIVSEGEARLDLSELREGIEVMQEGIAELQQQQKCHLQDLERHKTWLADHEEFIEEHRGEPLTPKGIPVEVTVELMEKAFEAGKGRPQREKLKEWEDRIAHVENVLIEHLEQTARRRSSA